MVEATDLIKTLLDGFKAVAKTETIVGEGIKVGEYMVLPVSKISLGIGAGAGTEQIKTTGGSGGAGGRWDLCEAHCFSGSEGRRGFYSQPQNNAGNDGGLLRQDS